METKKFYLHAGLDLDSTIVKEVEDNYSVSYTSGHRSVYDLNQYLEKHGESLVFHPITEAAAKAVYSSFKAREQANQAIDFRNLSFGADFSAKEPVKILKMLRPKKLLKYSIETKCGKKFVGYSEKNRIELAKHFDKSAKEGEQVFIGDKLQHHVAIIPAHILKESLIILIGYEAR